MRIAICVRGGIRTWDKCKGNILSLFKFQNAEVNWFFDTWDRNDYAINTYNDQKELVHTEHFTEQVTNERLDEIRADFDNAGAILVHIQKHDLDHKMQQAKSFARIVYLSNLSKRKHEAKLGLRYDVVVHIRPDILWTPDACLRVIQGILKSPATSNVVNLDPASHLVSAGYHINPMAKDLTGNPYEVLPTAEDRVFYGASNAIDTVASLYEKYEDLVDGARAPHICFANHCMRYGIFIMNIQETLFHLRPMNIEGVFIYDNTDNDFFNDLHTEQVKILQATYHAWYQIASE